MKNSQKSFFNLDVAAWLSVWLLVSAQFTASVFAQAVQARQTSSASSAPISPNATSPDLGVQLRLERLNAAQSGSQAKDSTQTTHLAAPGETVQYAATYSNQTHTTQQPRTLVGVLATLPIPAAMRYTGEAQPKPTWGSADGAKFEPYPMLRPVKQADGSTKLMPLEWHHYKALRWQLADLPVQTSQTVRAQVKVQSNETGVTSGK